MPPQFSYYILELVRPWYGEACIDNVKFASLLSKGCWSPNSLHFIWYTAVKCISSRAEQLIDLIKNCDY